MREIWKSIPGWEGLYVVSNLARVKHLPYTKGKGKHIYSETILKPYKNNSGYYMVALFTNNRKAMMNWRKGASNANAKPIIQLSKESKFIKRFGCIMDAERETGILNSSIVSCLKGHQKTAGGYKWEYVI